MGGLENFQYGWFVMGLGNSWKSYASAVTCIVKFTDGSLMLQYA